MSWVYPTSEAAVTTRLGIESAFFAVATVFLGGALAALALGGTTSWQAFAVIVALWVLLAIAHRARTTHPTLIAVMVLGGGVLAWCLGQVAPHSGLALVSSVIAVTALGSNLDRWTGAIGTLVGYALAQGALLLAPDGPIFEPSTLIVAAGVAAYYTMLAVVRRSSRAVSARIDHAVLTDIAADERRTLELQTRTLVHDTILSELAAIATMPPGPLSDKARTSIRRSLDSVREARGAVVIDSTPSEDVVALVERAASAGVTVVVSGEPSALELLPAAGREALLLAAQQALVNVSAHAQTDAAELSIIPSGESVVLTVVDNGVGFDESAVPPDRFGFRESILGRVEAAGGSARILSSPGFGTSVILAFPITREEG
ncbi:hypothetical protein M2152_002392 [Microbacteriaceae bacterium SG_E_30_P1]|uniref:Signal transduction histidine kinase n=1 Tax=Antiquaquibacter oligotrophicus TaxID=2880260 RepID=A0ABT6KQF1_9MICO|nr:hypothetical protein [Antiquaquibacter oligotrophicus]MDH6182210.1 hypothetical protein [Antiquaquibacter oligotrophicus]UDF12130.1 hypothetical protein LH407_08100 [Antiquaquibacter oligotrophicus]